MSKCLVLFVEGDTEVEFYKQIIVNARKLRPGGMFDTSIECKSINGVGGFKNIALRKFVKEIKPKYDEECIYTIVLCRDTDVFELSPKPPIKWEEVERDLRAGGANNVIHVEAKHSIEDWFLYDSDGIISFLRLNKKTKISGKDGYDKLKRLYKLANKMYYKGMKSNGMVSRLDIDKIANAVKDQLDPLYKALGVDKN
jgi:hypothetical protein